MAASPGMTEGTWRFLCPECDEPVSVECSSLVCPGEGKRWPKKGEIYPLLSEEGLNRHRPFLEVYRTVRRKEGWVGDARYYLDLPFRDRSGRHSEVWRIRARTFRAVLEEIQHHFQSSRLRVLELGAGNCWFSSRLAGLGHRVLATDISLDEQDGLSAFDVYRDHVSSGPERAQADMERLPLADAQFDLVVANGAIHYAHDLHRPIAEAHRLLRANGLLIVMDSPCFWRKEDGQDMVLQRAEEHGQRDGVGGETKQQSGYLLLPEFVGLMEGSGFKVEQRPTFDGIGRLLRRWTSPLTGWRPPAEFIVFVGYKTGANLRMEEVRSS